MNDNKHLTDLQTQDGFNKEQIELITNTIAKGATTQELQLFLMIAKRTGLDPFTRQIHFVKRRNKTADGRYVETGTTQCGIDGYRAIAEKSKTLAGIDDAVFDTEKDTHPNKATVTVWRFLNGQRVSFTASARWSEYAQTFQGQNGQIKVGTMWAKMPYLMLAKCAEALALRKAFPNDLSGIYTNEEMAQADNTEPIIKIVEHKGAEIKKDHYACDRCDGQMIEKLNRSTGEAFYSCSNYPKCKRTKPHDELYLWDKKAESKNEIKKTVETFSDGAPVEIEPPPY